MTTRTVVGIQVRALATRLLSIGLFLLPLLLAACTEGDGGGGAGY
jgi:hypothetical protein